MIRKLFCLMLCLMLLPAVCSGEGAGAEAPLPRYEYSYSTGLTLRTYDSETLYYTVEKMKIEGVVCYLSKIWVRDPARQIRKQTSAWKENIQRPIKMAQQVEGAALVINGSGYVSPTYPWIPEEYPGESPDYYYTPLGSLTVTGGEIFRNLEGIPYYGLTLEGDGLHMYTGEDNEAVLARSPRETWSFYVECPMLWNNEDILPEEWPFADRLACRTVIGRVNRNNYVILSVSRRGGPGLSLRRINQFFQRRIETEWLYDLDGGPSSALICRAKGRRNLVTIMGGEAKDADIMAFTELPQE